MFIWVFGELRQLCAKIGKFWGKIHSEMIRQRWLLLAQFFNFPIVQWSGATSIFDGIIIKDIFP